MVALIATPLLRRIDWRGVTYDLQARGRIRLREYRPYGATHDKTGQSVI